MTKIIKFLCATGVLATMLGSSVLWSQNTLEITASQAEDAVAQNTSQPTVEADKSSQAKESATASERNPPGDFKPSEEISEDFPVPLPSDI